MSGGAHTRPDNLAQPTKDTHLGGVGPPHLSAAVLPQVRDELRRWERRTGGFPTRPSRCGALGNQGKEQQRRGDGGLRNSGSALSEILCTACNDCASDDDRVSGCTGRAATRRAASRRLALHGALAEAVTPGAPHSDWYRLRPQSADGGYLAALGRNLPARGRRTAIGRRVLDNCAASSATLR